MDLVFTTIGLTFVVLATISLWGVIGIIIVRLICDEPPEEMSECLLMSFAFPVVIFASIGAKIEDWIHKE